MRVSCASGRNRFLNLLITCLLPRFWRCLKSMLSGNHKRLAAEVSHGAYTNQLRDKTSHANDFINRLKAMLLAGWYSLSLPFSIKPLLLDSFFKTSVYICCAATDLRKVCMILAFPPLPFAFYLISGCLLRTPDINSNFFRFP